MPGPGFPLCTNTHKHTRCSFCFSLRLFHTQTLSCLCSYLTDHTTPIPSPLETTNAVSYLPLVPALFCQVTSFVSFLLFASLTLSPTPPSLARTLFLSDPYPPFPDFLPLSLYPSVDKPVCWVCSLAFSPLKVTVVLFPLCSAQGQKAFILILSERLWALSCVRTVCYYFVLSQQSMSFCLTNKGVRMYVCIFVCRHKCVFLYQKPLRNVVNTGPLLGKAQPRRNSISLLSPTPTHSAIV